MYSGHPISQRILELLVPSRMALTSKIGISHTFLVCCGLTAVGGFIRYQSYRAMGRFFTLSLALLEEHKLITSGPYAYVRHPSYTGMFSTLVGMTLCCTSRGSWLRECHMFNTPVVKVGTTLYVVAIGLGMVVMVRRCMVEDAILRKQFEEQWDEWAGKVRYRMLPYVY